MVYTVAVMVGVGCLLFAGWHLPGFVAALFASPPPLQSIPVDVVAVDLPGASSAGLGRSSFRLRVFVREGWRNLAPQKLPVVIYLPSWGGSATDNDVLLRHIAGAGYLVIAADDVAQDAPEPGESAETTAARNAPYDLSDTVGVEKFVRLADGKVDLEVRKVSRILDALTPPAPSQMGTPLALADMTRVAVVGYSFGGSVAAEALRIEPRIVAAINIDGWNFGSTAGRGIDKPFLVFGSTNSITPFEFGVERHNTWTVERLSRQRDGPQLALPHTRRVVLQGTLHGDYGDGLHHAGRWRNWRPWHPPIARAAWLRETIDNLVVGFLDENVRDARRGGQGRIPTETSGGAP